LKLKEQPRLDLNAAISFSSANYLKEIEWFTYTLTKKSAHLCPTLENSIVADMAEEIAQLKQLQAGLNLGIEDASPPVLIDVLSLFWEWNVLPGSKHSWKATANSPDT
jgi:hypothetical protein